MTTTSSYPEFVGHCLDLLASAGPCVAKRMFGGWGISTGGLTLAYRAAPEDAMESPGLMRSWGQLALDAAVRAHAAKPARTKARAKPSAKSSNKQ